MNGEAYNDFSEGIIKSNSIKRLIFQNCNIHEKDFLNRLSKGIQQSQTLEYIDFQLSNLSDKHTQPFKNIIKDQFEYKENLTWKLGLRAQQKVVVHQIGIKYINLAKNNFGKGFAEMLAD